VKTFGEPGVDGVEPLAGVGGAALRLQELGQLDGSAQLREPGFLLACERNPGPDGLADGGALSFPHSR
jgi:hypothetical protein